jgi:hypothetical protein
MSTISRSRILIAGPVSVMMAVAVLNNTLFDNIERLTQKIAKHDKTCCQRDRDWSETIHQLELRNRFEVVELELGARIANVLWDFNNPDSQSWIFSAAVFPIAGRRLLRSLKATKSDRLRWGGLGIKLCNVCYTAGTDDLELHTLRGSIVS